MEFWPVCAPQFVGWGCAVCDAELEARDQIAFDADERPTLMHWHCYEAVQQAYIRGLSEAAVKVFRYGSTALAESMMADLEAKRTRLAKAKAA